MIKILYSGIHSAIIKILYNQNVWENGRLGMADMRRIYGGYTADGRRTYGEHTADMRRTCAC